MTKHVDCTGIPIQVGDFIVYSVTSGYKSALQFGLVRELKWEKNKVDGYPKLSCITVDNSWRSGKWELQKKGGRISLQVGQTLVLRPNSVLPEIRDLLLGVP